MRRLSATPSCFAISNFSSKLVSLFIQPYLTYALDSPDVLGVTKMMHSVTNLLIPVVSLGVSFAVIRFGLDKTKDKASVFFNGFVTILTGFAGMLLFWPLVRMIPNAADYLVLLYLCVLASCPAHAVHPVHPRAHAQPPGRH